MAKKVLILDSNKKTVQALKNILRDIHESIQIFEPEGYDEACKIALETQIDVFLLDVVVTTKVPGDVSGLKFAECIRKVHTYLFTPIIFITSIIDQKLYAFQHLHCFAYLEKPFSVKEVKQVIAHALLYQAPIEPTKVLYFRAQGILYAINQREILYVKALCHVLYVYTHKETLEVPYYTIKQFLKESDDSAFIQCSRNTVINKRFIKNIDVANRYIKMEHLDSSLEIGASFIKSFMKKLRDIS